METTKRKYTKHKKERKIAVEYKLYKSKKNSENGTLYIEIRAKNQNTFIKSRLNISMGENLFNQLFKESLNADFLEFANYEKKIIEDSIRKLDPENNEKFNLTDWYKLYSDECDYSVNGINTKISSALGEIIKNELRTNFKTENKEICLFSADEITISSIKTILEFLATPYINFPFAKELLLKYKEVFENYHNYTVLAKHDANIMFHFCLIDWKTGFFQKKIRESILKTNPNKLFFLDLIDTLMKI